MERQLLADCERIARTLFSRPITEPKHSDCVGLFLTMNTCIERLVTLTKVGGEEETRAAINNLLEGMRQGCRALAAVAADEKSNSVLKTAASVQSVWPVMLSRKENSYLEAKKYLHSIGVGTASNPPTTNSKISTENHWPKLASEMIAKIHGSRAILNLHARQKGPRASRRPSDPHPAYMFLLEKELLESKKWEQVLDLPAALNLSTRSKWWPIVEEMLEAHWNANPDEAERLFASVKEIAKNDEKTPQGYATRAVKRAFLAIAKQGA